MDPRYRAMVETYAQQQAVLVSTTLRILLALWGPFRWWGRPDMVNAWAAESAVIVDRANATARRQSRAFMLAQLRELDALPADLPPIVDTYERGGTPLVEVYKRPARQREHIIRTANDALARQTADLERNLDAVTAAAASVATEAADLDRALADQVKAFEDRLDAIVQQDLAATARDEAQKVLAASPKVIGYRRVIHPELSATGTCGLCVVASSNWYSTGELMPLHDRCKCTIAPITADSDPGGALNRADRESLDQLYAAAGSNYAEDLLKIRITVHEHGEYGPILRRQGQHFRDLAEVNQDSRVQYNPWKRMDAKGTEAMWAGMKAQSERALRILEDARDMGTNLVDMSGAGQLVPVADLDLAIKYHKSLIARAAAHGA